MRRATLTLAFVAVFLASSFAIVQSRRGAAQDASPEADCPSTTSDENVAIATRLIEEVYNNKNLDVVDELFADGFPLAPGGLATPAAGNEDERAAFEETVMRDWPDIQATIEDAIGSDDKVALRITVTGAHADDFEFLNVPATNRSATWENMIFVRIECGQIAELWSVTDNLSIARQLGVISAEELASVE